MRGDALRPSGLHEALHDGADKQALVDWVFDHVADRYDMGNDLLSAGLHRRWRRRLVDYARLEPGHRVLDVAAGTGDVSMLATEVVTDGRVVATDNNERMLDLARAKRDRAGRSFEVLRADAADLPFEDGSFDRVLIGYAGRGFPDWAAVAREAWRVLAPGGELWSLDFARPAARWQDRAWRGALTAYGAALGTAVHGNPRIYVYIPQSLRAYPGQHWLDGVWKEVGFETRVIETRGTLMAFNQGIKPR